MIPLLDTHLHVIYPNISDYWKNAQGLGIESSIFMEVSVDDPDIEPKKRFMAKLALDRSNRRIPPALV